MQSPGQFDHPLLRRAKCEVAAAALAHAVVPAHGVTLASTIRKRCMPMRAGEERVRLPAHVEHPSGADRADRARLPARRAPRSRPPRRCSPPRRRRLGPDPPRRQALRSCLVSLLLGSAAAGACSGRGDASGGERVFCGTRTRRIAARRARSHDHALPRTQHFAPRWRRKGRCRFPARSCAYHAILAEKSGFRAIYLSGGGVAAGSLGVPDLGISGLDDVLTDVRRITDACTLPLLVDVDTGFGASAFNIARTRRSR